MLVLSEWKDRAEAEYPDSNEFVEYERLRLGIRVKTF
jgi:hypothetical protein